MTAAVAIVSARAATVVANVRTERSLWWMRLTSPSVVAAAEGAMHAWPREFQTQVLDGFAVIGRSQECEGRVAQSCAEHPVPPRLGCGRSRGAENKPGDDGCGPRRKPLGREPGGKQCDGEGRDERHHGRSGEADNRNGVPGGDGD